MNCNEMSGRFSPPSFERNPPAIAPYPNSGWDTVLLNHRQLMSPHSNLRGIIAMVLALGLFIASDSASKLALAQASLFELMAIRGHLAAALCLILIGAMDQ